MPGDDAVVAPLRGSPDRLTDFMEKYQEGIVRSVAAASGTDATRMDLDEGVDLLLTHRSPAHSIEAARIEVQLKATYQAPNNHSISVQLAASRYDYLRTAKPSIPKLLIVMSVPRDWNDWLRADDQRTHVHHALYWVNLQGLPASDAKKPTASAPFSQRFDDVSLCEIMARVGQGGAP